MRRPTHRGAWIATLDTFVVVDPSTARRTQRRIRTSAVFALVWLLGCTNGGEKPVRIDLAHLFPYTEAGQEADAIHLGTAEATRHLLRGWSEVETLDGGEQVSWALARRTVLGFAVRQPADRQLILRCGFPNTDATLAVPVPVLVSLNGVGVDALLLHGGLTEYQLPLPARLQHAGRNRLELFNPGTPQFHPIACEGFQLTSGSEPSAHPTLDGDTLVLPAATRVDFFLHVPRRGRLTLGAVAQPPGAAVLRIWLERDGGGMQQLVESGDTSRSVDVDLGRFAGDLARLDFEASGEGLVRVTQPQVNGVEGKPQRTTPALRSQAKPGIVLYLIDTLRADHLGCYGYTRPTSPHFDALAADGVRFASVVAQASWTTPATASILTGRYPYRHGAVTLRDRIRPEVSTLAERLRSQGYATAAVVSNVNVRGDLGFKRGFDEFVYLEEDPSRPSVHVRADEVQRTALAWLAKHTDRPYFLYVHVSDPHAPYTPPENVAARFVAPASAPGLVGTADPLRALLADPRLRTPSNVAYLASLYDAEIAATDESFGKLVAELQRLGVYDRSLIVVTADHGEEFGEHGGLTHGRTLYRELLTVPLLLHFPHASPQGIVVPSLTRQIDIVPTLLDYLGATVPGDLDGISRLTAIGGADNAPDVAFAETSLGEDIEAVVSERWAAISSMSGGGRGAHTAVFDLVTDGNEQHDVAARSPVLRGYASQLLAEWAVTAPRPTRSAAPAAAVIDAKTAERLRVLGYAD